MPKYTLPPPLPGMLRCCPLLKKQQLQMFCLYFQPRGNCFEATLVLVYRGKCHILVLEISQPRTTITEELANRVHARQHTLIAIRNILSSRVRTDIGVSKQGRFIARFAGFQCDIGMACIKRSSVQERPVNYAGTSLYTGSRATVHKAPPVQNDF